MRLALCSLATAAVLALVGCRTEQARFTLVSTKNVEISRVDLKHAPLDRNCHESDGRLWFLFIPLGSAPTIDRAMDSCLKTGGGDFMVNTRLTNFWWTCLLFSYESYQVQGDVGNSVGGGTREVVPDQYTPNYDRHGVEHN